ncbi:MAG: DUF4332 domain-containing protein [Bacteroidota bacterium]
MGYYIDLKSISIVQYKEILKASDLLPSRLILKDNIENYFDQIKNQGVQNVDELLNLLKTKKKLQDFAVKSNLPENYLTILIREIKSYRQKPTKIKDFLGISDDTILKLEKSGIKNTLQLFEEILTSISRKEFAKETGIDKDEILKIAKLADLSRIRWVNHTFAFVLLEANYDTAEKVAKADYKELYETIKQLNEERKLYKAHIGLHDMKRCVEAAKNVSLDIEY